MHRLGGKYSDPSKTVKVDYFAGRQIPGAPQAEELQGIPPELFY